MNFRIKAQRIKSNSSIPTEELNVDTKNQAKKKKEVDMIKSEQILHLLYWRFKTYIPKKATQEVHQGVRV